MLTSGKNLFSSSGFSVGLEAIGNCRFADVAKKYGFPSDTINRMDENTKRKYVASELVDKPIDKYKGLVKRMVRERIKDLDTYDDDVLMGLYAWTGNAQGRGVGPVVNRAAATQYIAEAVDAWKCQEVKRASEASLSAAIVTSHLSTQEDEDHQSDDVALDVVQFIGSPRTRGKPTRISEADLAAMRSSV